VFYPQICPRCQKLGGGRQLTAEPRRGQPVGTERVRIGLSAGVSASDCRVTLMALGQLSMTMKLRLTKPRLLMFTVNISVGLIGTVQGVVHVTPLDVSTVAPSGMVTS